MTLHGISDAGLLNAEQMLSFGGAVASTMNWADASNSNLVTMTFVPVEWTGGNLAFVFLRRGAATNTAVMRRNIYILRPGAAVNQIETAANINFTPGNTNTQSLAFTVAASNLAPGYVVRVDIDRIGADAGDTMTAAVDFDGAYVGV